MTTATRTIHFLPVFTDGTIGEWHDTGTTEDRIGNAYDQAYRIIDGLGLAFASNGGTVKSIRFGQTDCAGCQGVGDFRPPHYASRGCRSGQHAHCTCRACF